ncbi:hypothetical protein D3Z51_12310 [Clostridiaceae bacterium]|nr:hypothetical protein [Clostridiaceae bacterium]RKI12430.1 hypothetical protein D7V81_12065 [bacterium 1XD21-70]
MEGRAEKKQAEKTRAKAKKGMPHAFGIRHLSPAGAYYVREYLDRADPQLVLIEGPEDFSELIGDLGSEEIEPPVAVMAYTKELPVRTVLYPFAVYSPEYQAILWAKEHGCECRFCDLPSEVFLGLEEERRKKWQKKLEEKQEPCQEPESPVAYVYRRLDELSGDGDNETFWERTMEHAGDVEGYHKGAAEFGRSLRALASGDIPGTEKAAKSGAAREGEEAEGAGGMPDGGEEGRREDGGENAENRIREAYMRRVVARAVKEGTSPEKIVVITGAFHVEGLMGEGKPMTEKEWKKLPRLEAKKTLMPYSYFRLSERSGYGAGNRAPAYYELLWEGLCRQEPDYAARRYLAALAAYQREHGNLVSSAEIIEAMRLSLSLAGLHGGRLPTLRDLRDAAVTCMGHGSFSEVALAVADTEIGTRIGSLPEGVSQTSIQSDFYRRLGELRLERYKSVAAQDLSLDLREKLTVKSQKSAFLDLERSFFLHRLRVLGISFAAIQAVKQERATWAEQWQLRWTPEAEIQIVEAVLKGDTIEQAASFALRERTMGSSGIAGIAAVIEDACDCGMPTSMEYAVSALQGTAVDAVSVTEIAETAGRLSSVLRYGDIRHLDRAPLVPILSQLFLRACLLLAGECACDEGAAKQIAQAVATLHEVSVNHDFLDGERWRRVLFEIAARDDLNTRLSGLAAAILLEAGQMNSEELGCEVQRRLSKGIPAELGAGWFAGLSMKNHYALIARLNLWEKLSEYLVTLDDEEFKRALVFLRRAFADFTSEEKNQIAENLGEIWQVNPSQASEVLNGPVSGEELEMLSGLDDFDFGDI